MLQKQLERNHSILSQTSRAHLLSSAAFFLKNSPQITLYLDLLRYLKRETDPLPWLVAQHDLQKLFLQFRLTPVGYLLSVYFQPTISKLSELLHGSEISETGAGSETPKTAAPRGGASVVFNHRYSKWCRLLCATRQPVCETWASDQMLISTNHSNHHIRSSPCAAAFFCHRMRHHLSPEEADAIRVILDDGVPLSAVGHILKPLLCVADYELKQRLFNASMQQNRLITILQGLLDPLTLEYDPLYHEFVYDVIDHLKPRQVQAVRRWIRARNKATGLRFNAMRWAALRPSDFKRIEKLVPRGWHGEMANHELELLWIQQMAPQLTDWLTENTPGGNH